MPVFGFIAVWFTFLIGEKLYDRETGFWAGLLLFSSPIFFAQSGLLLESIPVTALTASTIYFFIKGRKIMYVIFAALLALVREVGVLVIIAIVGYEFLINLAKFVIPSNKSPLFYKIKILGLKTLFYILPLIFFLIWIICNKLFLGWFLWPMNALILKQYGFFPEYIKMILDNAFWIHFRFLISIAIVAALLTSLFNPKIRNRFLKKEFLLFLILTSGITFFYMWVEAVRDAYGNFAVLPRYYLFLQVLFFVFGAAAIVRMFNNKAIRTVIFAVIISLFVYSWYTPDFKWAGERNLSYRDIIEAHKEAAEFLEKHYYSAAIITTWPIYRDLTELKLGYVKKVLPEVYDINHEGVSIDKLAERIRSKKLTVTKNVILLVIPANGVPNEEMFKFLRRGNKNLLKEIDLGIEKVWIYLL
jgi:hypothetical protein